MAAARAVGMLAEMLAAGLNANLGGRDHMPIEVERQVVAWMRVDVRLPGRGERHFRHGNVDGQPDGGAGGANRGAGIKPSGSTASATTGASLTAYTSKAAHGCITKAMDIAGFGSDALRSIGGRSIVIASTSRRCARRSHRIATAGLKPFLVVGSAGTVDIGAIDDLVALERAVPRRGDLVSCRWRLWRARNSVAGDCAAAGRN